MWTHEELIVQYGVCRIHFVLIRFQYSMLFTLQRSAVLWIVAVTSLILVCHVHADDTDAGECNAIIASLNCSQSRIKCLQFTRVSPVCTG